VNAWYRVVQPAATARRRPTSKVARALSRQRGRRRVEQRGIRSGANSRIWQYKTSPAPSARRARRRPKQNRTEATCRMLIRPGPCVGGIARVSLAQAGRGRNPALHSSEEEAQQAHSRRHRRASRRGRGPAPRQACLVRAQSSYCRERKRKRYKRFIMSPRQQNRRTRQQTASATTNPGKVRNPRKRNGEIEM